MATYTTPRQRPSVRNLTLSSSAGNTPTGRDTDIEVGDTVEVPGGMDGTVRFVGEVRGKNGFFVGVELSEQFASRGKNSGDAEGVRYFSTSVPGAGIFLPFSKAVKREPRSPSTGSIPPTPTTPGYSSARSQASPTPAMPSISKSLLGRAPSPALKPNSRPSLPRPESPIRRSNMAPPRPPSSTARPSLPTVGGQNRSVTGPRFASPAPTRSISKTPSKAALTSKTFRAPSRAGEGDGEEMVQMRALLAEKNERIKQLTVEFDSHRQDFRNTLDALEMASTETQRVYEAKVAELETANEALARERGDFAGEQGDFEMVAKQLRDVEIVVQELEDGLEDARRGEAEARGEVEFLRGEVERLRAELRWEREQGEKALEQQREREYRRTATATKRQSFGVNGTARPNVDATKSPEPTKPGDADEPAHHHVTPSTSSAAAPVPTSMLASTTNAHDDAEDRPVTAYGPSSIPPLAPAPAPTAPSVDSAATAKKIVDEDKWCALCEQEGHDIMNCPNEDKL